MDSFMFLCTTGFNFHNDLLTLMSCRHCQIKRISGKNILEKRYLFERYLNNFFAALVASDSLTSWTLDTSYLVVYSPVNFVLGEPPLARDLAISWRASPTQRPALLSWRTWQVISTFMDGPYRLPCRTVPVVLTRAAWLRADGISSYCYVVNVCTQQSVMTAVMKVRQGPALHVNSSLYCTYCIRHSNI